MGDLANKMVMYRAKHNISMEKLAQLCGVSLQTINSVEKGTQNPSRLTEQKIRLVVDVEGEQGK